MSCVTLGLFVVQGLMQLTHFIERQPIPCDQPCVCVCMLCSSLRWLLGCMSMMHAAGVAAARVADSDREAGHWVMEFAPAESASR